MSRRARAEAAAAAQGPGPPVQLQKYAFTIYGWALEIPPDVGRGVTILSAYEPSTMAWEKAATTMTGKNEEPWRKSLALTSREMQAQDDEPNVCRYLLVGLTLPGCAAQVGKFHSSQKKQQPVGTQLLEGTEIKAVDHLPVMVVVKIQDTKPSSTHLFALLRPRQGLCTPFQIGQISCFYLPMFRDDTTALGKRGPAWNELALQQCVRPSALVTLSAKQEKYKKARDTSKVVLEPIKSITNELSLLIECFAKSREMWHLEELSSILQTADKDLVYQPPSSNNALRKFADAEETDWQEEDSAQMAKEFNEQWPDMLIDPAPLATVKAQLVKAGLGVDYHLLRPFVIEALHSLDVAGSSEVPDAAVNSLHTVKRVMGPLSSTAPTSTEGNDRLIIAILKAQRAMIDSAKKAHQELKDSCGDQTAAETLHDIWEKFADSIDKDAAKLAWFQSMRYLITTIGHHQRGVVDQLEDLVEVLEKLGLE